MDRLGTRLRVAGFAVLASALVLLTQLPAVEAASAPAGTSLATRVILDAESHLGAPYRWGSTGPSSFDCSGLVYRVFQETGLISRIGSGRVRTATQMLAYFRSRGLASSSGGQPGDLVIWGGGSHVGIYLGGGRAISALVDGVRIHSISALTRPFTAFLHTGLSGGAVDAAVSARVAGSGAAASGRLARVTVAANVRRGPGTGYARVALVPRGGTVHVLRTTVRQGQRWSLVRMGSGRQGWISTRLIRLR